LTRERAERRLAAILAADVAGYSRLMGADEAGTARVLREHRAAVDPVVSTHGGRIVKTTGDGVLLEFPSIVAAVECAVAVQKLMAERNADVPEDRRMLFRIGINLGDVLIEGKDILGDGVNVAARLEAIAEPGSICISDAAYQQVRDKLDLAFEDAGEKQLKNIVRPVRVYAISGSPQLAHADTAETSQVANDQPSIVVLPFICLSDDRQHELLADGMTEDIITLLARLPGFFVIARQSSFVYKHQAVDIRRVGKDLGVRYVVEGSLRPMDQQVRVSARLIEASAGTQLWANQFDTEIGNAYELQDQIARGIAGRIEPELTRAEIALIRRRGQGNVSAWSFFREGYGLISLKGWSEETVKKATDLLQEAVHLDPDFALARAQLALLLSLGTRLGLTEDGAAANAQARAEGERAVQLDQDGSEVLGLAGCALAELGDPIRGSELLESAVENDPSNAQAWVALGGALCLLRRFEEGIEKFAHGMRLSPRDYRLAFWGTFYAIALARVGRLADAYEQAKLAVRRDPRFYAARLALAITAMQLDRSEEATKSIRQARRLRPKLSFAEIQLLLGRRGGNVLQPLWTSVVTNR
jgi:adenylate cyclase